MPDEHDPQPVRKPSRLQRMTCKWCRVLLVILIALMLAGFAAPVHRGFDLVASFQAQFFVAAVLLFLALFLLRSWSWSVIALTCVVASGWLLSPLYAPGADRWDGVTPPNLRIMLFNVHQPGDHYADIIAYVREIEPDVVVFQEANERWFDALQPLLDEWPHAIHQPGGTLRGMAVFSRLPLENVRRHDLNNPLSPSIAAEITVARTPVSLLMIHPWPPVSEVMTESRDGTLDQAASIAARAPRPAVLIGDLNITPWSPGYRQFEHTSGLFNARRGHGVRATYPMDGLALLRVPIDHVLVSPDLAVAQCTAGNPCGSDHAPLIVDLVVPVGSPSIERRFRDSSLGGR